MIILTQNSSWSTAEPAGVVEVSIACFHLYAVVQHVPKYQRQCPMSWKVWIWQISHIISVKFITSCGIFSTTSAQQRKESRHWLPARTQSHINSLWQHRVCWCEQMSLWFDDNNLSDWITGGIFFFYWIWLPYWIYLRVMVTIWLCSLSIIMEGEHLFLKMNIEQPVGLPGYNHLPYRAQPIQE